MKEQYKLMKLNAVNSIIQLINLEIYEFRSSNNVIVY